MTVSLCRLASRAFIQLGNPGCRLFPVLISHVKEPGGDLDTEVDHPGARIAKGVSGDPLAFDPANRVFDIDAFLRQRRIHGFFVVGQFAAFRLFDRNREA